MPANTIRFIALLGLLSATDQHFICAAAVPALDATANNLVVYGPVPGLASSDHYAVRVRPADAASLWQTAFVFKTACKDFGQFDLKNRGKIDTESYCPNLSGWSHSYVNFETAGPVEIEIAKADGKAIRKATVHPMRYGSHIRLKGGKIRDLTFDNVTIGGKKLTSVKDFKTNEYVENIHFK
jgi:hypothetical protein